VQQYQRSDSRLSLCQPPVTNPLPYYRIMCIFLPFVSFVIFIRTVTQCKTRTHDVCPGHLDRAAVHTCGHLRRRVRALLRMVRLVPLFRRPVCPNQGPPIATRPRRGPPCCAVWYPRAWCAICYRRIRPCMRNEIRPNLGREKKS